MTYSRPPRRLPLIFWQMFSFFLFFSNRMTEKQEREKKIQTLVSLFEETNFKIITILKKKKNSAL